MVALAGGLLAPTSGASIARARERPPKLLIEEPKAAELTPYDRAVRKIADDGTTSLANARRLFSMVVAALPGVHVRPAKAEAALDPLVAIEAILQHFDALTTEEQQIVREALVLPVGFSAPAGGSAAPTGAPHVTTSQAIAQAELDALLAEASARVAARVGPAPHPIVIVAGPQFEAEVFAGALFVQGTCRVIATPLLGSLDAEGRRFVIAHELGHCYAYARDAQQIAVVEWIREGGADFVAASALYGNGSSPISPLDQSWVHYVAQPTVPTYRRELDGIGVFAFGQAHGVDAARLALDSSRRGVDQSEVLSTLLGGAADDWPGSWWRRPEWGPQWDMTGPGITPGRPEPADGVLRNGHGIGVRLPPATAGIGRIRFGSDLLVVEETSGGNVRLEDGTTRPLTSMTGTTWCTGGECVCPPGTRQAGRTFTRLPGTSWVMGVTGGVQATRLTVRGRSLEDECHRDPLECLVGRWTATSLSTSIFSVRSGGDGLRMDVDRNHDFALDFSQMTEVSATIPNVPDLVIHFRIDGAATGTWALQGDQISGTDIDARVLQSSGRAEIGGSTVFTIGGSVEELITSAGGTPSQTDWVALDCSPTTMRLSHPVGEWTFARD